MWGGIMELLVLLRDWNQELQWTLSYWFADKRVEPMDYWVQLNTFPYQDSWMSQCTNQEGPMLKKINECDGGFRGFSSTVSFQPHWSTTSWSNTSLCWACLCLVLHSVRTLSQAVTLPVTGTAFSPPLLTSLRCRNFSLESYPICPSEGDYKIKLREGCIHSKMIAIVGKSVLVKNPGTHVRRG